MRKGNTKLFTRDPNKLTQMLNLRRVGLNLTFLQVYYGCDHTSIMAQCEKYQVIPLGETYGVERIVAEVIGFYQDPHYKVVNGERINLGKSYAEYVADSRRR